MRLSKKQERIITEDYARSRKPRSKILAILGIIIIIATVIWSSSEIIFATGLFLGVILILFGLKKKTDRKKFTSSLRRHKVKLSKRQLKKIN